MSLKRKLFPEAVAGDGSRDLKRKLFTGATLRSTDHGDGSASSSSDQPLLSDILKRDWSSGKLSSKDVQQYAASAVQERADPHTLGVMGKIACGGKWGSNAQRDLMMALGRPQGCPDFYWAQLPVAQSSGGAKWEWHPFILPHELFATLLEERSQFFSKHVIGSPSVLKRCWIFLSSKEFLKESLAGVGPLDDVVPVGLHADAGAYSKKKSLYVFTWGSLVGQGSTKQKRFVMTTLPKQAILKDGRTLDAVWQVVAWSLNALRDGTWPSTDHLGQQLEGARQPRGGQRLPQNKKGVTLQMRGDWEWMCQCFNFPRWNAFSVPL